MRSRAVSGSARLCANSAKAPRRLGRAGRAGPDCNAATPRAATPEPHFGAFLGGCSHRRTCTCRRRVNSSVAERGGRVLRRTLSLITAPECVLAAPAFSSGLTRAPVCLAAAKCIFRNELCGPKIANRTMKKTKIHAEFNPCLRVQHSVTPFGFCWAALLVASSRLCPYVQPMPLLAASAAREVIPQGLARELHYRGGRARQGPRAGKVDSTGPAGLRQARLALCCACF